MWAAVLRRSGLRLLAERSVPLGDASFPKPLSARRWLSNNPEEPKPKEAGASFKIPGHKPTGFEKKILVWGGRFKKVEDIPDLISYDMVDAAKSRVRVKFAVLMMAMTIFGCIMMVVSGKAAAGRHESLANFNLEKKARIRDEALKEETSKKE
ncbi:protein FAM162A-like [Spea bombifrons]|uniref:protein FAM162A-like n=1 Tax=Spea bombifrons TaxID=233779 RepID=UPI00234A6484|nr:protein FAM162A-like [Spea bombifrons]